MGIRQRLAHYFSSTPNSRGQLGVLAEQGVVVEHGESLEEYNEKVCMHLPWRYREGICIPTHWFLHAHLLEALGGQVYSAGYKILYSVLAHRFLNMILI